MMILKRLLKWILAAFVIYLLILTIGIGKQICSYPQTITRGRYDCAIVLGAAVYGKTPSPVFQARIDHAIQLYQSGIVSHLIFTGGIGTEATVAESEAGKEMAIVQGIPATAIFTETVSRTTHQNLEQAKRVMNAEHLKTAVIVSDPLHLFRSYLMAKDMGLAPTTSATPTTRYTSFKTKLPFLLREIYFTIHYAFLGE